MPSLAIRALRVGAAFLAFAAITFAQTAAGLTGIVTDPSQARLGAAKIEATHEATGVVTASATNEQGEFTFPSLPPGRYRLVVETQGFQRHSQTGLVLETGHMTRNDVQLRLGTVADTVEVSSQAPLLESETATVGQFIENKTVRDMPLQGRRVGELLRLLGGANFITGDIIRPRVSIAGSRGDQQQWLLDGVNASNVALEIPQALFNPPVESVQEIRVQQSGYPAEYGNSSGGVVSIVTRSGTNQFHGSAYEFFRNDALDARNFFSDRKPPLRYNIFGFAVGGPVRKNRTFFFSSVEWQRQRQGVARLWTLPTTQQREGDFSQTFTAGAPVVIYDPATTRTDPANPARQIRDPFPGNRIPVERLDPVGRALAALYPLPNRAAVNLAGANNFAGNAVNVLNLTTWTTKVDHVLSDSSRLSVRFLLHDFPTSTTALFPTAAADPNASVTERRAYSTLVNHIQNFGSHVVNDARFNWQPRRFRLRTPGLEGGWPTTLGLRGVSDAAFPQVAAAGFINMGNGTQERIQTPIHDAHLVDAVSWLRGSHALKFGGEVRWGRNVDDLNSLASGSLSFAPQSTALPGGAGGNALASLLLGLPLSAQILDTDILDRRSRYYAAFVQDDWKVSTRFTLNVGVRWETHTPRVDVNDRQNSFDRAAINPVSGTPGIVTFAGRDGLGSAVTRGDYNNVAPRIGLAWRPAHGGGILVRAGYGLFYGPPIPGSNTASAGFETSGEFSSPDNGVTSPFLLRDGFPAASRRTLDASFGAVPVGTLPRFAPTFLEPDRALGYSQQWNLTLQRELPGSILVETAYLANVGHKLPSPNTSINQVRPELLGAGNAQVRRPFPQFGNVTVLTPMWGNSSYHGLNLKAEKRFSHGVNFLVNYTWSKFIDDVSADFEAGGVPSGIQNLYDRQAERALSGNDIRHRLSASSVYEVPVGPGRRFLSQGIAGRVLGGWNVGVIAVAQSGSPYGLVTQANTSNSFAPGPQRVNVLRDPSLPGDQRTVARYFDVNAVTSPVAYTFGNSSRALLTGPGLLNIDLSLLKNIRVRESWNVQFRAEATNAFNRANFQEPGRVFGSPTFGAISEALPARVMQLGLKIEF